MREGSIVVLHLVQPTEKYWGVLEHLSTAGVTVRGINLVSFQDFLRDVAGDEPPSLGLATIFFPLARLERMFLDEQVGAVESFAQRFERRVGKTLEDYLLDA